ncbi:hypothetical protein ACFO3K_01870 [Cellulomonas algicola]|uniref:hypothetical protein n=1 Tax=Cellulomonas algicola TaxID=2071633 RepID=UPI001C3FB23D|nr:hypothetical protein [Cellulomonas algicola]
MTPRVRTYTIQNSYGWAPVSKHFNFNWGTQTYRYQYANGTRGGSGSWAAFSSVWIDTAYTSAYCVSGSDPV